MKISDRDVKILYIVLAIAVVACSYFFGFRKITDANNKLDKEIKELKSRYTTLDTMRANAKTYSDDTVKFNAAYDKILSKFDTGFSQEYSILFIKELENKVDTWMSQAGLAQTENIYTFGKISSSNPNSDVGVSVYQSDYKGYKTVLTLSYQTTYDNFKNLIDYINGYKYKCTIDSMSMSYNSASEVVSGSLVVSQYAITGADRKFDNVNINGVLSGTGNIFDSAIFNGGESSDVNNGDDILSNYDYYISLQSADSNVGAVVVAPKSDLTGSQTVSSNANERQDLTIRFFEGDDASYYVQYTVGDVKYPEISYDDGTLFLPGEDISLLVISSARVGDDDLAGVMATIINETSLDLRVKIINEDKGTPRFVVDRTVGNVVVYE